MKDHPDAKGVNLAETMEGDVVYAAEGTVNMNGGLHGVARVYRTNASVSDIKSAFESEGPAAIRAFVGLARYSVVKLADGRVGTFGSFDTPENARKSSEEAPKSPTQAGSQIGRCLPSDPQVLEGTISGSIRTEQMLPLHQFTSAFVLLGRVEGVNRSLALPVAPGAPTRKLSSTSSP